MADEEKGTHIQVNMGESQRNAQRDYIEVSTPQSIKLYLAITPQTKIDERTLDNVDLFRHRFGFEAARHAVRSEVIALRQRLEMTDREIRWQRYSGQLQVSRTEAKLVPDRMMPIVGWIQLILLSILFSACLFYIGFSGLPALKRVLDQLAVAGVWFGVAGVLVKLYIEPWSVLKKVGAR